MKKISKRHLPWILLGSAVLFSGILGTFLGQTLEFEIPDVAELEDYSPPVTTQVYAADGTMIQSFAEQRRLMIRYEDIPQNFKNALLATEDSRFFDHPGLDPIGIVRVIWTNFTRGSRHGASTITQQLARSLFLNMDKTYKRKFREALLTLELERHYTKEEIFGFYCNQIYMGHGRYGIEAASHHYFNKTARELELHEAALLAGIIQRPESISPFKNLERAKKRRAHVLDRMVDVGAITPADAEAAKAAPLPSEEGAPDSVEAPYFVEEVRRWVKAEFGDDALYREGYEVKTTLDPQLQAWANEAIEQGLRDLDKRQGWRGAHGSIDLNDPAALTAFTSESWAGNWEVGKIVEGIVLDFDDSSATIQIAEQTASLPREGYRWTGRRAPKNLFEKGQQIFVRLEAMPEDSPWTVHLEQTPQVEAALIAIEPATGEIKALVGGFDFRRSEFDRAMQARRQTGSAFKPFVYATALAQNWTLADTLVDEATVFVDPSFPDPYIPKNYTNQYYGTLTLRRSLEKSANVSTVKLLNQVGAQNIIRTAKDLGITGDLRPYPSLALGAFESTLLELTSAYGAFANRGVRIEPHFVLEAQDGNGKVIHEADPLINDALSPQVADLMNLALRGVITHGTAAAAASLGVGIAGKTGTTDDSTDAWFIGYNSDMAVGVWVGFDKKTSIGKNETGSKAALPIWIQFMRPYLKEYPSEPFPNNPNLRKFPVDRATGLRANPNAGCARVIQESFAEGTEPRGFCSTAHHRLMLFPPRVQYYPLTASGVIQIPDADLNQMLQDLPTLSLSHDGRALVYQSTAGPISLALQLLPGSSSPPINPSLLERLEQEDKGPSTWKGIHGGPARLEYIR